MVFTLGHLTYFCENEQSELNSSVVNDKVEAFKQKLVFWKIASAPESLTVS